MSFLDHLYDYGMLQEWLPEGGGATQRTFWYSNKWAEEFNGLVGSKIRTGITKDMSEKGRVAGLINQFVSGVPRARMATPVGFGSDPIAKRLTHPREAVVYFRTGQRENPYSPGIRCFGFFRGENHFVALRLMRKATRYKDENGNPVDPIDPYVGTVIDLVGRAPHEADISNDIKDLITP